MNIPFTQVQFMEILAAYNQALGLLAPIAAYVLAVTALVLVFKPVRIGNRLIMGVLALFWLVMGAVYHLGFFTRINPAAYVFGTLFILQGLFFLHYAVLKKEVHFRFQQDVYFWVGAAFIVFAMFVYPLWGMLAGHAYPAAPMFGTAPCPTTIFTFGVLLFTAPPVPKHLLVIPLVWSIIGFNATFAFGIHQDVGLLIAGIVGSVMIWQRNRKHHIEEGLQ